MLSIQLERAGHAVQVAYGGEAALQRCGADGCPGFDIALIDLGMPDMDGWTLARRLRAEHGIETIVAVTGYGSARARARSKEAGIDRHLVKPASAADIERALELGKTARSDDAMGSLDLSARLG